MATPYIQVLSPTETKEWKAGNHSSISTSRYYARLNAIDAGAKNYQCMSLDGTILGEFPVYSQYDKARAADKVKAAKSC